jgi:hypothetical protein
MRCNHIREKISLLLDRNLTAGEHGDVLAHMTSCRACQAHFDSLQFVQEGMRTLPIPAVPPALTAQLRVIASHERARHLARVDFGSRVRYWTDRIRLAFDNMMRPFAVPVTGGVFSAVVLFSVLVPNITFLRANGTEPPIAGLVGERPVVTDPEGEIVGVFKDREGQIVGAGGKALTLVPGNTTISGNETSLILLIDDRGRVEGYYLYGGELTEEMTNLILLSQFTPATASGQRTWGLTQVVFHHRRRMRS